MGNILQYSERGNNKKQTKNNNTLFCLSLFSLRIQS